MDRPIKILLLGDEGVGKSSIISTYISRHFPQEVPHVMIDVTIPREMTCGSRLVTIMDSSARPEYRDDLIQKIAMADSIAIVYDVNRRETWNSINEEWVPLIKEVTKDLPDSARQKQIIVFGNKSDLLVDDEIEGEGEKLKTFIEHHDGILALVCSAMQLETIVVALDKAYIIAAYPVQTIFDLVEYEFTPAARRAFLRIFRMFDVDDDNLLNDEEISQFHHYCFQDTFSASEIQLMKRTLLHHSTPTSVYLQNNSVTFEGLLCLFREALNIDDYTVPWRALFMCNYDEQLHFETPLELQTVAELKDGQCFELSPDAVSFLLKLARHAYQENTRPIKLDSDSSSDLEECLTAEALRSIFATALEPGESHPWMDPPAYKNFWDAVQLNATEPDIPQSTIFSGWAHADANVSFVNWVNHWHLLATTDPALVQSLLHKLGYVFRANLGLQRSDGTVYSIFHRLHKKPAFTWRSMFYREVPHIPAPRRSVRICVLGDNRVGKSSFVWHLSGLIPPGIEADVEVGTDYPKPADTIVVGGCRQTTVRQSMIVAGTGATMAPAVNTAAMATAVTLAPHLTSPFFMSFSAIPVEHYHRWMTKGLANCDLAVLMFECGNMESLEAALDMEQSLPLDLPRIFVGSKVDLIRPPRTSSSSLSPSSRTETPRSPNPSPLSSDLSREHNLLMEKITAYTQAEGLPRVTLVSTTEDGQGLAETFDVIRTVMVTPKNGIPLTNQQALRAKKQSLMENPRVIISTAVGLVSLSVLIVYYRKEVKDWMSSLISQTKSLLHWSAPSGLLGL